MPPLKGIDRGLNGDALKVLEEAGHGTQIVIVDPSYDIPEYARVIPYQGDSSASALMGILSLVPHEKDGAYDVTCMAADEGEADAGAAFKEVTDDLGLDLGYQPRLETLGGIEPGFYADANGIEKRTIFFRTRDEKTYACARFTVGHSQK